MFLDGKTYLLSITNDDGELVYIQNGQLVSNNGGFSEFRLKFYGVIPKCTMHIENIKALSHSYIKPYTFIFDDGDNINITLDKAVDAIIYKAIYDEEFSALRYIDTDLPSIVSVNKKERCKIFALDENINPVLRYIGFNEAKENE